MSNLDYLLLALIPLALVELCKALRWRALFGRNPLGFSWFLQAHLATAMTNILPWLPRRASTRSPWR